MDANFRALANLHSATIEIENFHKGKSLSEPLTRAKFEALNKDLFLQTLEPVKQALKDAKMRISDIDDIVLVGGSTRIPYVRKMLHDYFGKSPMTNINPDEAVAMGAIIQGCVINDCPGVHNVLMMDVNPLTLGIETDGGIMAPIIKRGTGIPTNRRQVFSTTVENQETVRIRVFEGELRLTRDNNELGEFLLSGIPPAPKGVPQIEVEFELDSNGILTVHAADHGAGISASVTIKDNGRLSADEIERMVDAAAAQRYKTDPEPAGEFAGNGVDSHGDSGSLQWEHNEL
jgi:endoplasmic reticulum chaperone BiP